MDFLIIAGLILASLVGLSLLAVLIRVIVVWIAKKNGYCADDMPIHYHVIAFGAYFSILAVIHALYLTYRSM